MSYINLIGVAGKKKKKQKNQRKDNIWKAHGWEVYKIDDRYESADSRSTTIDKEYE